jgi:hypothetical protein
VTPSRGTFVLQYYPSIVTPRLQRLYYYYSMFFSSRELSNFYPSFIDLDANCFFGAGHHLPSATLKRRTPPIHTCRPSKSSYTIIISPRQCSSTHTPYSHASPIRVLFYQCSYFLSETLSLALSDGIPINPEPFRYYSHHYLITNCVTSVAI